MLSSNIPSNTAVLDKDLASGPDTTGLPEAAEGYRALLQNRNFLALWVGQILSQLGDRVVFVVFVATIVHYFGASDSYNSFLYIAFTIPAILLTAIAGVFVDRWPRRAMLVITNLVRAALVFLLPWAATRTSLWPLYGLAFAISGATQFFVPAEAATIPTIVKKSQLITANSLFTTTMMGSIVFGFALGDPLINIFSLQKIHWPLGILFLLASFCLLGVKVPKNAALHQSHPGRSEDKKTLRGAYQNFIAEMSEGITYIRQHPQLLRAMLKLALLFSAVVALCILFVSFAKQFLYDNPEIAARKFAYIITFSGIGMVLGALAVGRFGRNNTTLLPNGHCAKNGMIYGGFSVLGICLLLLGFIEVFAKTDHLLHFPRWVTPYFYLDEVQLTFRMLYTYILSTVMGIGAAFVAIPLQSLIHELIPEDKRGKILGVQFTILSTSSTLPVLIAGLGAEQIGPKPMFLGIGLTVLVVGVRGLLKSYRNNTRYASPSNR